MTAKKSPKNVTPRAGLYAEDFITLILPTWTDQAESRRRDIASAVSCLARGCGLPLNAIRISHNNVSALVRTALKACRPVSPNNRSLLKYAVSRLGGCAQSRQPRPDLADAWRPLYDRIPSKYDQMGVIRLLRYCSANGIAPEGVGSETLGAFEHYLMENCQVFNAPKVGRTTAAAWNRVRPTVPGWPSITLTRVHDQHKLTLAILRISGVFSERCRALLKLHLGPDADLRPFDRPAGPIYAAGAHGGFQTA